MLALTRRTLQSRIAIQILVIDDYIQQSSIDLNGRDYPYFVAGIVWLYNLIVGLGHISIVSGELTARINLSWLVITIIFIALWWGFVGSNFKTGSRK